MLDVFKLENPSWKGLDAIQELNADAEHRYKTVFRVENMLTRSLVSFQGNKKRAVYRWFKYKEGFSAGLVERLLDLYHRDAGGILLDPFAVSGTALFAVKRGISCQKGLSEYRD